MATNKKAMLKYIKRKKNEKRNRKIYVATMITLGFRKDDDY